MKATISVFILLVSIRAFASSVDNPHGTMTMECGQCHTTAGWSELKPVLDFDHNKQSRFELLGRHVQTRCMDCHTNLVFTQAGTECLDCHTDVHRGQFAQGCAECHTPESWTETSRMAKMHDGTRFPLVGVHALIDCQACHSTGQFANLSIECESCHLEEFQATSNPHHPSAGFSLNCTECHSVVITAWKNPKFEHSQEFQLAGGHRVNDCNVCHSSGYSNTSNACISCHVEDFAGTTNPNHETGGFSNTCQDCHNTNDWDDATLDDHNPSDFPLDGAHVAVDCASCHVGGQYTGTPMECYACHQADFDGVEDPNHVDGSFSQACTDCHTTSGWSPASFDHEVTEFPLTGAHISQDCAACHANGVFQGTPIVCNACHQADFDQSTEPNHIEAGFPFECEVCHTTTEWDEASFDHTTQTQFELTGAHITESCIACHANGVFDGTPTDCWSCHQTDFEQSTEPNHVTAEFSHDCAICHTTSQWEGAVFDHGNSDFPLTGAHITQSCNACHANGIYNGTPTDCWSCHQTDYEQSTDPNHTNAGFPHECAVCHTTTQWEGAVFDHNTQTQFVLTGAHIQAACTQCHANGVYDGTPTDCWSCHQTDYEQTTDPNHTNAGFPHDCAVCHTTSQWDGAVFDHSNSDFPLTGAHITQSCAACHANGVYDGTPTDCWSCHQSDYDDTDDPDHVAAGFPHDCALCHNTNDWDEGIFNHNTTDFPLTGAHIQVACLQCHIGGQYEGTPTDCFFCHQDDYDGTNDPDHQAAGFPTTCADCHTTSNWNAQFDHDDLYFPIYSGRHEGEWNLCIDCHTTPNDFSVFSCIDCHEHDDPEDLADRHDEVSGYVYESNACYACHPTGDGDDGPRMKLPPNYERKIVR